MANRFANVLADIPHVQTEPEMLDQARKRLHGLSTSLEQLANKLRLYDAMPTWESLQATNDELSGHLGKIRAILTDPQIAAFFRAAHPYPLPTFPGAQQQGMLAALTRKRFEIPVQDWTVAARNTVTNTYESGNKQDLLDQNSLGDLWDWVPLATGDVFREAVRRSGLQGEEDNEEEEGDGDQDDAMEGVQKGGDMKDEAAVLPAESMDLVRTIPFMLTGILPPVAAQQPVAVKRQ